jgi:FkbM family methyltransferase
LWPTARFLMIDGNSEHINHHYNDLYKLQSATGQPLVEAETAILNSGEGNVSWHMRSSNKANTGDSIFVERASKSLARRHGAWKEHTRQSQSLDGLLARSGRAGRRFGLIKLDVQGAELRVLMGGTHALSAAEVVVMEFGNIGADLNRGAPSFAEKIAYMDQAGFRPWAIVDPFYKTLQRSKEGMTLGARILFNLDMIFVRKHSELANRTQIVVDS